VCPACRTARGTVQLHHLAVPDLETAFAFYIEGLGWEPAMHVPDDLLMIRVGDQLPVTGSFGSYECASKQSE
jgi:predicted enzyme related to lactoylglutathione lyase